MHKQTGLTMLELLIGLSIMSGVSFYTMAMTEKVEDAVVVYQDSVQDMQAIKQKLKLVKQQADRAEENETFQAVLTELDNEFYFEE